MLNVEWLGIADAVARDSNGSVTLVGLNRNVVVASELPTSRTRTVIVIIQELPESAGAILQDDGEIEIGLEITSPSGKRLLQTSNIQPLGKRKFPDLPSSHTTFADMNITLPEYGTYAIGLEVSHPELPELLTAQKEIFVVSPDQQAAFD